jgi:hypothetical protein
MATRVSKAALRFRSKEADLLGQKGQAPSSGTKNSGAAISHQPGRESFVERFLKIVLALKI